ncbi:MAG: efflux RND transporter permease subunit [Verrucomicrobiales bacterium]|nr:efflux RND transporter permease subunit [Verrucomicrobiales bacterium]
MIAFFARNSVAANLLMAAIILAGAITLLSRKIPLEVFPEFESNWISVSVPYRGATPEEVEETIVVRIEEAIANVEGIEQIISTASSSSGSVNIEVDDDYDRQVVRDEVEARIDALADFPPNNAERPTVRLQESSRWVISVVLSGDMTETDLRRLGETVRDDLVSLPEITGAELQGVRPYEISIEIDEAALQRHNLSFGRVAQALRSSSIDVPAGTMKTDSGEIALRTKGRAYSREAFENITVATREDGSRLTIRDVATVSDGFDENPFLARHNRQRCVLIAVFREGNQSAIRIADTVRDYMETEVRLPAGTEMHFWSDSSKIVRGRLHTLLDSFWKSMLFVFIILTLFLRPSLAFWVAIGIPICFLGTFAAMPYLGVSINIVSLFGFILVLGVVVDDAIVTGENIYTHQKMGKTPVQASIDGTHEVTVPVVFGVLTTMLAFIPLFFLTGFHGSWMPQIAMIVITVLAFSLIESKLILPSHLTHSLRGFFRGLIRFLLGNTVTRGFSWLYSFFDRFQQWVAGGIEKFVHSVYQPTLRTVLANRYIALSIFIAAFTILIGLFGGGRIQRVPFPRVDSERATCRLTMQEGTPFEVTEKYVTMMEDVVYEMKQEYVGPDGVSVIEDVLSSIGGQGVSSSKSSNRTGQSHRGEVVFFITPPEERELKVNTREIAAEWRRRIDERGGIVGAKELYIRAEIGRGRDPIEVQLRGQRISELTAAASEIREKLGTYEGLFDISDNLDDSRDEIQLKIRPEAEQFGLNMTDLAQQVRQAFFGEEIQRLQRDRDEVRVMLRYPEADRKSIAALEAMRIRTADGQEVPFTTVADVTVTKSFPRIERIDRNRAVEISADADKEVADLDSIRSDLEPFVDEVVRSYPGMTWGFEGEARDQRESYRAMLLGLVIIVFGIYAMLAIPFRSYALPLIVMSVIPFGLIGAVLGHMIEDLVKAKGMPLSMLSYLGMMALAGVVVNDSLVLVDYINRRRKEGIKVFDAVTKAGTARFRAIILTSATTFAGLFPLIRMQSTQAQFLIPMAVSLGYGIVFATLITLFLVPINYLILEDIRRGLGWIYSTDRSPETEGTPQAAAKSG